MLTDYARPPEQIAGRTERTIPGVGTIVRRPLEPMAYRAINTIGVKLGDYRTEEDAESALRRLVLFGVPKPAPVARCNVCRGRHASADCPVRPTVDRQRPSYLASRPMQEETNGRVEVDDEGKSDGRYAGRGQGPEMPGARGDDSCADTDGCDGGMGDGADDEVPPLDGAASIPSGGDAAVTSPAWTDPHTLQDYAAALLFAAPRLPCKVDAVRRLVWGRKGGRDATELALDELVAQGRADRTLDGRYRARGAEPETARREQQYRNPVTSDLPPAPAGHLWESRARNAGGGHVLRALPSRRLVGGVRPVGDGWRWWTFDADKAGAIAADGYRDAIADAATCLVTAAEYASGCDLPSPAEHHGAVPSLLDAAMSIAQGDDDEPAEGDEVEIDLGPHEYIPHDDEPEPSFRTIDDVADKHAPERVIEEARALAARLPVARARLKERLDQRLVGVSADRAMLAELDRYAGALGVSDD